MNIKTSCQKCVFSTTNGITQDGCYLGRIDKLLALGVEIVPAYNEDGEFYVLNNYLCTAARQRSWLENVSDPVEKVYEEIALHMESIIPICNANLSDIENTAKFLSEQTFKPGKAHFIVNQDGIPMDHLVKMLSKYNINFEVHMVANSRPLIFSTLNQIINNIKSSYYIELKLGQYFPPTVFEYVNKLINYDMVAFIAIDSQDYAHCVVTQTLAHKMSGGHNYYVDSLDIIKKKSIEEDNEKMIKIWEKDYNYILED